MCILLMERKRAIIVLQQKDEKRRTYSGGDSVKVSTGPAQSKKERTKTPMQTTEFARLKRYSSTARQLTAQLTRVFQESE